YYHNKKNEALNHINNIVKKSNNLDVSTTLYPNEIKYKPNIHIIVLESFLDPSLIVDGKFNNAPLAEELEKYLGQKKDFSHVVSPVFGGSTAQAEFEIITGVPALAKIESIEFNTMEGAPINSFVRKLRNSGYFTSAMIGSNDTYFNSRIAYKSLGFEQVIFLRENTTILDNINRKLFGNNTDDKDLFDGDLFEANLEMFEEILQMNIEKKPILNYMLGFYGHYPFNRNIQKRPDVIASSHSNKKVHKAANQFYYRTKSLALFIDKLLQIDPNCIILVISDHLPALFNKSTKYKKSIYENIAFFLKNGKFIDITGKKFYEIPWLIWDILSKSKPNGKRDFSDSELTDIYFNIIAEGMGM
ncbi:MAG: sulfatase-like hydrolase/transferase, partial [Ignavibacteria bacterium]|nr:sulfatase-like hydrolase/transferase [Ignavibacteria bacterium]